MQKKIQKTDFGLAIVAFELVALNTRFYLEIMLVSRWQYVNKLSQDFIYY